MRILVTGACGSVMREVVPRLIELGYEVRGVDNFMRYGQESPPFGVEFIAGDLTDGETVRKAVRSVDGVIQGAAQIYGVGGFHRYPADILQADTMLHGLLLREALRADVRRVAYISSSMVYERISEVAVESDVPNMQVPLTDYGLSKLMGERLSQAFAAQYGLEYTVWRPFNIIGLHEDAQGCDPGVCHVFADFVQRIVHERQNPMDILGSGEQVRCFTWVGDVAAAIAEHSFSDNTRNADFNLGNPEPVTMKELAYRIHQVFYQTQKRSAPPLELRHLPVYEDDVRFRIPSIEKARRLLNWKPSVGLDEMLGRCVEHALRRGVAAAG